MPGGQLFGKVKISHDSLYIVNSFLHFILMRGQVSGDEEETSAEYHEGYRHCALRSKRRASPRREAVLFRDRAEPDQISSQK